MDGQKTYHILIFLGAYEEFNPDLKELGIFCDACKMQIKISAIMKLLQFPQNEVQIQLQVNLWMPKNNSYA